MFTQSPTLKTMSTVPVVVTEPGRNCTHCGRPLTITVLEFYADPHPTPVATREGFVDCPSGCTVTIDPRKPDAHTASTRPAPRAPDSAP